MTPYWFIFRVETGRELDAFKLLRERGFECYCPVEIVFRWHNGITRAQGRKYEKKKPLFPGYLFIQTPSLSDLFVDKPDYVWRVLGSDGIPHRYDHGFMLDFIAHFGGGEHIAPSHHRFIDTGYEFNVGDEVRVIDGPFRAAMEGVNVKVENIKGSAADVMLELFGATRLTPIPLAHLHKAG